GTPDITGYYHVGEDGKQYVIKVALFLDKDGNLVKGPIGVTHFNRNGLEGSVNFGMTNGDSVIGKQFDQHFYIPEGSVAVKATHLFEYLSPEWVKKLNG